MKIIKGIDRIAFLLAVISIVPGFIIGWDSYSSYYKKKNTIRIELTDNQIFYHSVPGNPPGYELLGIYSPEIDDYKEIPDSSQIDVFMVPELIPSVAHFVPKEIPIFHSIISGIVGSAIVYLIVYFGLCGMSRGIKLLFMWIIEGFKDDKKS